MDPREVLKDHEEALRAMLDGREAQLHTAFPGIVVSFNAGAITAVVQPAIKYQARDPLGNWNSVTLPLLFDCPVHFPSGGGFTLTFPLAAGDEVFVCFAERCIDGWWQSGGIQAQPQFRMHDLSDGFCFPKVWSKPNAIASVSTANAQLRSDDGQTLVDVGPGKIQLIADEVVIHGRNKATFDAGGTGFVYQVEQIDNYTEGVTVNNHPPNPPEVPT